MNLLDKINNKLLAAITMPQDIVKPLSKAFPDLLNALSEYQIERVGTQQTKQQALDLLSQEPVRSAVFLAFVLGYLSRMLGITAVLNVALEGEGERQPEQQQNLHP